MQSRNNQIASVFNDYDWTGFTYDFYYRNLNDPMWYYDSSRYGEWGGNGFGPGQSLYYGFADYYQLFGGKIQVSGSSTYKWKWLVPDMVDQPGVPDYDNFPVPYVYPKRKPPFRLDNPPAPAQLFMLGRVQGSISADADWPGVTADGQMLDEWTNAANVNLQQFGGLIPPMLSASTIPKPTHGIAAAKIDTTDSANATLMSLLSPTPFVEGYYVPNFNAIGPGDAYCNLALALEAHAFAIELGDSKQPATYADNGGATTLDLFKYAQARGDGGNQFVYNKAGNLFIPAAVTLNGAPGDVAPNDTYYLAHNAAVQLVTDIYYTDASPYTLTDTLTNIVPRTPVGNGTNYDGLVYYGLPQTNYRGTLHRVNDLGNHIVQLKVNVDPLNLKLAGQQFQNSELAHIQTFFKDTDNTHPFLLALQDTFPSAAQTTWPNWFYYYLQVYLQINPNAYPFFYDAQGIGAQHQSYYVANTDSIHTSNNVNSTVSHPVFGLRPGANFISWIGNINVKGLDHFVWTAAHEQGHRNNNIGTPNNPPIEVPDAAGGPGGIDQDSDGLLDVWESAHHFDPNNPDTTGVFNRVDIGTDAGKQDREVTCEIQAMGAFGVYVANKLYLLDWSTNGTQFGKLPWPADQPQWTYTPFLDAMGNLGTPTNVLPADALYALP